VFELSGYHLLLTALGLAVLLAYWFPRLFSAREPAAAGLLIGLGLLMFGWYEKDRRAEIAAQSATATTPARTREPANA
jgi:hypothetical protein